MLDHEGHCMFLSDGKPGDLNQSCHREQPAIIQAKRMSRMNIAQFTCLGIGGGVKKHDREHAGGARKGKAKVKTQTGDFFWLKQLSELLHGRSH